MDSEVGAARRDQSNAGSVGSGNSAAGVHRLAPASCDAHYSRVNDNRVLGTIARDRWSFSGGSNVNVETNLETASVDRPGIHLTDVHPASRYRLSPKTNIGMAPYWRHNRKTEQLYLPLGISGDTFVDDLPRP